MAKVTTLPQILAYLIFLCSLFSYGQGGSCESGDLQFVVNSTESAADLITSVSCSGGSFFVTWTSEVTLSETISVGESTTLNIQGSDPDTSVIDGGDNVRIFFISNSAYLVLTDVSVVNGVTDGNGGAIYASPGSSVTVGGSSTISYNTASSGDPGYGGAIYAYQSNITVGGSATISTNTGVEGGGIYAEESDVTVGGSAKFSTNTAQYGGAIRAIFSTVTMGEDTILSNNTASGNGGAVYAYDSDVTLGGNAILSGNTADTGRAISASSGSVNVTGDAILCSTDCTIHGENSDISVWGGSACNTEKSNCCFSTCPDQSFRCGMLNSFSCLGATDPVTPVPTPPPTLAPTTSPTLASTDPVSPVATASPTAPDPSNDTQGLGIAIGVAAASIVLLAGTAVYLSKNRRRARHHGGKGTGDDHVEGGGIGDSDASRGVQVGDEVAVNTSSLKEDSKDIVPGGRGDSAPAATVAAGTQGNSGGTDVGDSNIKPTFVNGSSDAISTSHSTIATSDLSLSCVSDGNTSFGNTRSAGVSVGAAGVVVMVPAATAAAAKSSPQTLSKAALTASSGDVGLLLEENVSLSNIGIPWVAYLYAVSEMLADIFMKAAVAKDPKGAAAAAGTRSGGEDGLHRRASSWLRTSFLAPSTLATTSALAIAAPSSSYSLADVLTWTHDVQDIFLLIFSDFEEAATALPQDSPGIVEGATADFQKLVTEVGGRGAQENCDLAPYVITQAFQNLLKAAMSAVRQLIKTLDLPIESIRRVTAGKVVSAGVRGVMAVAAQLPWVNYVCGVCENISSLLQAVDSNREAQSRVVSWANGVRAVLGALERNFDAASVDTRRLASLALRPELVDDLKDAFNNVLHNAEKAAANRGINVYLTAMKCQEDTRLAHIAFQEAMARLTFVLSVETTQQLKGLCTVTEEGFASLSRQIAEMNGQLEVNLLDFKDALIELKLQLSLTQSQSESASSASATHSTSIVTAGPGAAGAAAGGGCVAYGGGDQVIATTSFSKDWTTSELKRKLFDEEKRQEEVESILAKLQIHRNSIDFIGLEPIGRGGQGKVWKVMYDGSLCAGKCIDLTAVSEQDRKKVYKRFVKELFVLRSLSKCRRVVNVLGACCTRTELILVQEFVDHGSLRDVLDSAKLRAKLTRYRRAVIADNVCSGMAYLYARGIQHRDLKPANVLITGSFHAKLADFGLSQTNDALMSSSIGSRTTTAMRGGTVSYMAPEELLTPGGEFTEKADVFSFGVLLWEIIGAPEDGMKPWAGLKVGQVVSAVCINQARPPLGSCCPFMWRKLIVSCWQNEASMRPTFSDARIQITELLAHEEELQESSGDSAVV